MSHSRSQSRPPPKNPLPARFFRGAQVFSGWLLPQLSYILYLISYIFISLTSTFRFYNLVGEDIMSRATWLTDCLTTWFTHLLLDHPLKGMLS